MCIMLLVGADPTVELGGSGPVHCHSMCTVLWSRLTSLWSWGGSGPTPWHSMCTVLLVKADCTVELGHQDLPPGIACAFGTGRAEPTVGQGLCAWLRKSQDSV